MSLSRFSHFNAAIFSGSNNDNNDAQSSDSEVKNHLSNGAMIIRSGVCFRSRNSSANPSAITGSFVSVTADEQGNISDPISTVVRPDEGSCSSTHAFPLNMMAVPAQNNIGQVTIRTENENRTWFQMQSQTPVCCYGLPEPSIPLSIGNANIHNPEVVSQVASQVASRQVTNRQVTSRQVSRKRPRSNPSCIIL